MKNKVLKILSMCFAVMLIVPCFCFLTSCGNKPEEFVYEITEDGKYVYFGEYAQTIKAQDVEIMSETPDENGYYLGSDSAKYVKRELDLSSVLGEDSDETIDMFTFYGMTTASDDTVMEEGQAYYFKVEKLKWRVLQQDDDGNTLLLCDNAIDSLAWQKNVLETEGVYYNANEGVPEGTYANDYKYSDIRAFLTGEFYNKTFTDKQKDLIVTTELDNSPIGSTESLAHENTQDKVFLPSYSDLTNSAYGFDDVGMKNRLFANTDYAKAKGAVTFTAAFHIYEDSSIMEKFVDLYVETMGYSIAEATRILNKLYKAGVILLRSVEESGEECYACMSGCEIQTSEVNTPCAGVVPAIRVKLPNIDREDVYHEDRGYFKLTEYNGEYVASIIGDSMEMTEDDPFGVKLKSGKYNIRLGFEGYSSNLDYFWISVGFCLNGQAVEESEISTRAQALEYTTKIFVIEVDEESVLLFKNYGKCQIEKFDLLITKTA